MAQDPVKLSNHDAVGQMAPRPIGYVNDDNEVVPVSEDVPLPVLVVSAGATAVELQGNVAHDAADGATKPVKVGGRYNTAAPGLANGDRGDLQLGATGRLLTALGATFSGSDNWSNSAILYPAANNDGYGNGALVAGAPHVLNGTGWDRQRKPNSTGRLLASAASTNATSVKASAGDLHKIRCKAAAAVFLKLYNKATAPVVGTDTPVLTFHLDVGTNVIELDGHYFSAGIAFAITGAGADADATNVAVNDVTSLNITYA